MIIDGKKIAAEIQDELRSVIQKQSGRQPGIAVLIVGQHPPSQVYVKRKVEACKSIGILSKVYRFTDSVTEQELLAKIDQCNQDATIDGILVQLPLPSHIPPAVITTAVSPEKDVDGFHPINIGKLLLGETNGFAPCTPLGVKVLLERYGIEVAGKNTLIIGRSNIVGKPMAALLLQNLPGANATVTLAHSYTRDLPSLTLRSDLIISAMGRPKMIKEEWIAKGSIVIDVGISRVDNAQKEKGYELVGDVDFDAAKDKCSYITPVPGGVGPMTIAMLLKNTLRSYLHTVEQR